MASPSNYQIIKTDVNGKYNNGLVIRKLDSLPGAVGLKNQPTTQQMAIRRTTDIDVSDMNSKGESSDDDSVIELDMAGTETLLDELCIWAKAHNITLAALDELLRLLNRHGLDSLPSDPAVFLTAVRRNPMKKDTPSQMPTRRVKQIKEKQVQVQSDSGNVTSKFWPDFPSQPLHIRGSPPKILEDLPEPSSKI